MHEQLSNWKQSTLSKVKSQHFAFKLNTSVQLSNKQAIELINAVCQSVKINTKPHLLHKLTPLKIKMI